MFGIARSIWNTAKLPWAHAALALCALSLVSAGCAQGSSKVAVDAKADGASTDAVRADACAAGPEVCNGRDDDCDQKIDESFATLGQACSAGQGGCRATGQFVCAGDGASVECSAKAGDGGPETCDAVDNDCDGQTDEGFNVGMMCDGPDADLCAEGTRQCMGGVAVCSDTTADSLEVCDAADNDCDMRTDEGFALGVACDGGDADACQEGVSICDGAGGVTCSDNTSSTPERCNGTDDNCTGGIDEGFAVGQACSVGVGACRRDGSYVCNGDGSGVQCTATAGAAAAEVCGDGIDQDCNGADVACPTNDLPAGAIDISAGGTFVAELSGARDDDSNSATGCGLTGGRDLFYTFTLPNPEVVYWDTFGANFDTVVRIYAGTCAARAGLQACADDACAVKQSQGALQLEAGTYCLVVDQFSSLQTNGASSLTFVRGGRPGVGIAAASGNVTNTTTGKPSYNSSSTCQNNNAGPDQGFFFTMCPSASKWVSVNTCTGTSFDSIVTIRKGATSSTALACGDDECGLQSEIVNARVTGPGLFWFVVDGYNTANGAFKLTYTFN